MERTDRIDLAHVPSFLLGRLEVRPAVHSVVRDDGKSEILQHRVMQVLVALARAEGGIVTRDELTMRCWDGRVVGEDAINRILSRLRAVASGIGAGSFRIETVTRVGYRLLREGEEGAEPSAAGDRPRALPATGTSRRALLAGGGVAALAVLGGLGWWIGLAGPGETPLPAPVPSLMQQARIALSQASREGQDQAIGIYRHVVEIAPNYADAWGLLGNAYATSAQFRAIAESDALRARARAAGQRALALDPENSYGQVAVARAVPLRGHWFGIEGALRHAVAQHRDDAQLLFGLAQILSQVGRNRDALPISERVAQLGPSTPDIYFFRIWLLWSVNRLEEADRVMDEAASLYSTHVAIWFTHFYLLTYSGRAAEAIALAADPDRRPTGIPAEDFEAVLRVARAIDGRAPAEVQQVMAELMARARTGAGYAENALNFACAVGRLDEAFVLADAYFFDRGFAIPDVRFSREQGSYSPRRERLTAVLFTPLTQAMHADRRFDALVTELGLEQYWREAGVRPDYRQA